MNNKPSEDTQPGYSSQSSNSNSNMDTSLRSLLEASSRSIDNGSNNTNSSSSLDFNESLRSLLHSSFSRSSQSQSAPTNNASLQTRASRHFGREDLIQVIDDALLLLDRGPCERGANQTTSHRRERGGSGKRNGHGDRESAEQ